MEYRNSFENYAYLWVDDRQDFLRQFLLYGHVLTPEEIEAAGEEGVPETPPTLVQYKEQVDTYEQIFTAVEQFEVHIIMFPNSLVIIVNYQRMILFIINFFHVA